MSVAGSDLLIEPEPDPPICTPRIALVLDDRSRSVSVYRNDDQVIRRIDLIERTPQRATVVTTYSGPVDSPRGAAPQFAVDERRSITELARSTFDEILPADLAVLLIAGPAHPDSEHPDDWLVRFPPKAPTLATRSGLAGGQPSSWPTA